MISGLEKDYTVWGSTLVILNHYLEAELTDIVDKVVLTIEFVDGLNATFTIKAARRYPTIDPERAHYDLNDPADVETTITWREAGPKVVSIFDDDGHRLQEISNYTIEVLTFSTNATLTILNDPYLKEKLTDIEDKVVLTIEFDVGDDATFAITAIDGQPSIPPEEAKYDLDNPAAVSTTITWGAASRVDAVTENDSPLTVGAHYTVTDIDPGVSADLTILNDYLAGKLKDIEDSMVLTIAFDVGDPVAFSIRAIGTHPTIDPEDAIYDILDRAAVSTNITWREATGVVSITESDNPLTRDEHYTVGQTVEGEAMLTINDSYLNGKNGKLEKWGDEVELAIEFDFGSNRTFTIRAVDAYPTIDPTEAEYDLNDRANVTTTITWQYPTEVVSIVRDGYPLDPLVEHAHYTVNRIYDDDGEDTGTATLEIVDLSYLRFKIIKVDDKVELTIAFNVGGYQKFVITAVSNPRIDPDYALYKWDHPPDFLQIDITWGDPTGIDRITDDEGALEEGEEGDYVVLGNTLIILNKYLRDKLSDLKPVTLTIHFSDKPSREFKIIPQGTSAAISPPFKPYARHAPHDVATSITWGSATDVVSIVDGDGSLVRGESGNADYSVTRISDDDDEDTNTATLTIFHDPYLEDIFEDSGTTSVNLTIKYDVGDDRTFVVTTGCFIATAAYGTPMAEQIQILREFRDGYLVTNSLGQVFVDFYYRTSPPIAAFINEHPTLKPIVRVGLLPAVAMSAIVVNTTPAEKLAIIGLLALVSVAVAIWATRRRGGGPQYT